MDNMTTVSLVECTTPISLRSCGSSVGSLVQNRKRLKCCSPEKKISAFRSGTHFLPGSPDLHGRPSVSQQCLSLEGALVSSPLQSPLERHVSSPYCSLGINKWSEVKCAGLPSASDSSTSCDFSDEFSEEDLDQYVPSDSPEYLRVLGSKSKLHGMFEVPMLGRPKTKTPQTPVPIISPEVSDDCDRRSGPSPVNPPPSPINFRPSVEGFVVGGRKLVCPGKPTGSPKPSYSARDFVPGFVKHPLYHCGKCEDRVVEEEQSLSALNKKVQCFLQNRASHHRRPEEDNVATTLTRSQMFYFSPINMAAYIASSEAGNKSFIEVYQEKKRQKEEKEKEWREKQERKREGKQKEQLLRLRERLKRSDEENARRSKSNIGTLPYELQNTLNQYRQTPEITGLSDLSMTDVIVAKETEKVERKLPMIDPSHIVNDKCQIRRCWSDIWPFPDEWTTHTSHRTDSNCLDNMMSKSSTSMCSKGRTTPFYPLPNKRCPMTVKQAGQDPMESSSSASASSYQSTINMTEVIAETAAVNSVIDDTKGVESDSTMTATVIVPQKDQTCSQWITFNGDNEPILNNSPVVEQGCDTYLKRLQRSKFYSNSDPALPGNSQFCFQAVVDKRYNRWKRRRRKKKNLEFRRSSVPPISDSSDENEDGRTTAVERIIDRMYDQMNGFAPQTPGGSRDTPRIRNRRRRMEKDFDWTTDPNTVNYDASSEWTPSEKDSAQLSSSSGSCSGNPLRKTPERSEPSLACDDLCTWPLLEHYREEIMKRIQETTEDKQETMSLNDWLPDIVMQSSETSHLSECDGSNGSLTPVDQKPVVSVRNKSGTSGSMGSTPEPGASRYTSDNRPNASFSYSTWCRSDKSRNPEEKEDKLLSKTHASTWSEMGTKPCSAKRVGVIAVTGNDLETTFKAAIRPIKQTDVLVSTGPKQIKKSKDILANRTASVNLPSLSKNSKSQTVPKLQRTYINKTQKVSKRAEVPKEVMSRPKTQPQTTRSLRKSQPGYHSPADKDLLLKDYYLRSLYSNKVRLNSHVNTFNTGSKLKKTITVDNLDLGNKRNNRKKTEEDNLSNLSFTRSFTFSMFDLPEMYKVYNNRIERRANGQEEKIMTEDS